MQSRILVALLATRAILCTASCGQDYVTGDLVVARNDSDLTVAGETVEPVRRGQQLVVEKAKGQFLWVNSGTTVGWIQADTVVRSPKKAKDVSFSIQYRIIPKGSTELVVLTTHVPRTLPGRQTIRRVSYSKSPAKEFQKNGNKYAIFIVDQLKSPVKITIKVEARIYRFDLATASDNPHVATLNRKELSRWLVQERRLEKDAPEVQAAAAKIEGKDDEIETARNIMRFVHATLRPSEYKAKRGALGAAKALKEKHGDCTEYADLFVALCRAKGIPARTCQGFLIPPDEGETPRHMWAEFHTKRLGWISVDPLLVEVGRCSFERLKSRYVYTTRVRNDVILDSNEYCVYRYYGEPIGFEDPIAIHTK
jgi:transglutaminase-like putative cysteine protease